jgi:glycosyltransferase involved in cell wall biosynthesis
MVESSPNWGGQQYRLVREARWFRERGHKVLVLCGETSELAAYLERSAPWIRVEKVRSWRGLRPFLRFASIVRQWQPNIIHTRSGQDSTCGCVFHLSGYAVVRSRHIAIPEHVSGHDAARYRFGCRRIIAAAHVIKRDLVNRVGVIDSRIDVVGEGVDLQEFQPGLNGEAFRAEIEVAPESPLFGVIAMLRSEKGQRSFINAAARVLKSIPNARFVIVGGGQGSYAASLHAKIRQRFPMAPSPVVVTDYREDISHVMAALDVVVVPSLREAQTIVIPQAFAAGKPVIASRVGGIPELVRHEENGLLVQPADAEELAAAMLRLLGEPVLRADLASAGLRLARRELSFDEKAALVLKSYGKALDQGVLERALHPGLSHRSSPERLAKAAGAVIPTGECFSAQPDL